MTKLPTSNRLNILGFQAGAHSCGVAYIRGNELVTVIEEERLTRVKGWKDLESNFCRFPLESLTTLVEKHDLKFEEIDYFTSFLTYEECVPIFLDFNFDLPLDKYIKIDHHLAHCTASYYLSGFQDETMIFCADASGGNNYNSKTYLGFAGEMKYVDGITNKRRSLGHFYSALTELLGYKRLKDEGKIVGLSGHGDIWWEIYHRWKTILKIEDTQTTIDNHNIEHGRTYTDLHNHFFEEIGSKYWKTDKNIADLAFTGQVIFEEAVLELINNIHKRIPQTKKLALSGGIFANVKLNKRINELDWVEELFVLPPMGDEGLALGCAIATLKKFNSLFYPFKMENMYLGTEYDYSDILVASNNTKRNSVVDPYYIAKLLTEKKILGLYQGSSEHGARALGNRSIICEATNEETYAILNGKLHRNDFMPFAPAVLDEDVDEIFNVPKSKYTAEFMTLLVDTKEAYRDKIPTVVHPVDKTARIQIVTEKSNPLFYEILKAYKSLTGIGILVNTSFNVHNEPIVERPIEAFNHLRFGIIDALITPHGIFTSDYR